MLGLLAEVRILEMTAIGQVALCAVPLTGIYADIAHVSHPQRRRLR